MTDKKYYYSEAFYSMQGEGAWTGARTAWLRFYLCNLQCNGMGQIDPTNEKTYNLPYQDLDVDAKNADGSYVYNKMTDLPVFPYGCDSSYSWSAKFKRLQHYDTIAGIAKHVRSTMVSELNPLGLFEHPNSGRKAHMCFTGGEPLMKHAQDASRELLMHFMNENDYPTHLTYETNGTQKLTESFEGFMRTYYTDQPSRELFFSVSPKLWSVSGESRLKAIKPEIVASYCRLSDKGQLKFVCSGTPQAWNELEEAVKLFRDAGVNYPVYVMPIGATLEGQDGKIVGHIGAAEIANEALRRGYDVSVRAHVYVYGNTIGT